MLKKKKGDIINSQAWEELFKKYDCDNCWLGKNSLRPLL